MSRLSPLLGSPAATVADPSAQTFATASVTSTGSPVGGTGTEAGCYDTSANRNLFIAAVTAAKTDIAAFDVEVDLLTTDVALISAKVIAVRAVLRELGIIVEGN